MNNMPDEWYKSTSRNGFRKRIGHGLQAVKTRLQLPLKSTNRWRAKMRKANIDLCFKAIDLEEPETNLDIMKRRWALIMRNVDINMGFRLIDREDVKYKGFKEDGNYYIAEQVLHSKRGMQRMLAALLRVPVERLEETRKMLYNKTEGENE